MNELEESGALEALCARTLTDIAKENRALDAEEDREILLEKLAIIADLRALMGWTSTVAPVVSAPAPPTLTFSSSHAELDSGSAHKFGGGLPPPPRGAEFVDQPLHHEDRRMPQGVRRWCEWFTPRYVRSRTGAGEGWKRKTEKLLQHLVAEGHRGRSRAKTVPPIFTMAGADALPLTPTEVTADQVRKLREYSARRYSPTAGPALLQETRRFLRWAGNPVAEDDALWALPEGDPTTVRWVTIDQFAEAMRSARPRESAVLALCFLCGLRGVEVDRLRVRNVVLEGPEPSLLVLGKGRSGGKWRRIPLTSLAREYVEPFVLGKEPETKVVLAKLETIQKDVRNASVRAGARFSPHDCRRGFGRAYFDANGRSWAAVLSLQRWYGHSRPETTVRYLGIRFDEMRAGIRPFEDIVRASLRGPATAGLGATIEEAR
ncbi:MAG TPA: site-specific integrase [Thermoplasmata archaeon]|nr:site-specific integrase [Thermoplasmata archaeon]